MEWEEKVLDLYYEFCVNLKIEVSRFGQVEVGNEWKFWVIFLENCVIGEVCKTAVLELVKM